MSETEVRDYLERLTGPLPVRPAPVREVREAARRHRRRGWTLVGAAGLVTVGLIVAASAVPKLLAADSDVPVATPSTGPVVPDPGQNMMWVGRGRAVVAVPASWLTLTQACPSADRNFVYSWTREWSAARCLFAPRGLGVTVGIGSFRTAVELEMTNGFEETDAVQGATVLKGGGVWFQSDPGLRTTAFAVPDEDAYFSLSVLSHSNESAELDRILESLTILPEGYVIEGIDQITPER